MTRVLSTTLTVYARTPRSPSNFIPITRELVEDVRSGAFRATLDRQIKEFALTALYGPLLGPPLPVRRHVVLPEGRPAGKYRRRP